MFSGKRWPSACSSTEAGSAQVGSRPYDREAFRRSGGHILDEASESLIKLLSPEDTILRKLEWFRHGGEVSEQQWRDVLGMLVVRRGLLDDRYLESWAGELGLGDLLARARKEASAA